MNIGIDIDDTITETSEFLVPYVAKYFSIDIDYLKKNNICYHNNLPREYKEKERIRIWKIYIWKSFVRR